jgi:methionyl-tRNA formyltransferase
MITIPKDIFPAEPRIIFMGTPDFAVPTLSSLINNIKNLSAVVTQPDRPKGRGRKVAISPVKRMALEHNITVLQPERVSESGFCNLIRKERPDLIVVVAFGQILNKNLLMIPKWGVINIHASLLPKYRGAAPIQHSILNRESMTGLTVMRMDEGLDTGPILYQEKVPVNRDETAGQLHDRMSKKSGELIVKFLRVMSEKVIKEVPQDDSLATYAPKIDKSMSLISWERDAEEVSAHIRALDPIPGAYTILDDKKIKLFSSRVSENQRSDTVPGRVIREDKTNLKVETGKGVVEIREIQYPGKKRLIIADFLKGFDMPEGAVLGKEQ